MKPKKGKRSQKRRNEFKRDVKHYNDRKNRAATRQALDRGEFDKLSETTQPHRESVWFWD